MKLAISLYFMFFDGNSELEESGRKKTQLIFKARSGSGEGRIGAIMPTRSIPFPSLSGRSIGANHRSEARRSRLSLGFSPMGFRGLLSSNFANSNSSTTVLCANCHYEPIETPSIWQFLLKMPKYKLPLIFNSQVPY